MTGIALICLFLMMRHDTDMLFLTNDFIIRDRSVFYVYYWI